MPPEIPLLPPAPVIRHSEIRFFIILAIALSLLLVTSYVLGSRVERGDVSVPSETSFKPFPEVTLEAKSAYVYDARTKEVLFAKNEETRMPLASITKLMSALVALELSPSYGTVTITPEALESDGDSGLRPGERWALKDLLDFSLLTSSNDGIRAVALALGALDRSTATTSEIIKSFVGEMNRKAGALDLKNTYFWNETGLDESEVKGGAYGTARDVTMLMEYIITYHPELIEATKESVMIFRSLDAIEHKANNTNDLASRIPGFLGSKTGFTNTAGGNLAFVFDADLGRPVIVSILGSSEQGRFNDAEKLINATLEYLNSN
jgi:serine-type D-Ala-D-Ala carboxypeptidase (penicillin-binding protein 5/6)